MTDDNALEALQKQISCWISTAASVIVLPFVVNNLAQQRWLLGFGSALVLTIFILNALRFYRRQRAWVPVGYLVPAVGGFLVMCFARQGVVGALWSYPAIVLFYFLLPPRQARWVNLLLMALIVPAAFFYLPTEIALRVFATLTGISVTSAIFLHLITVQQEQLRRLAILDPLTQVYNRLPLPLFLAKSRARCQRRGSALSLIALDIDHFKRINDKWGHAVGDEVLFRVASLCAKRLRSEDLIFRMGGEEFLMILEGCTEQQAVKVAQEICELVATAELLGQHQVTVSLGVAQLGLDEELEAWVKRGDDQLYLAKSGGRNRVSPVLQSPTEAAV